MAFRASLQSDVAFDDADEDPYDVPAFARDMAFQALEGPLTSTHPAWYATVYYDPEKFPIAVTLERIALHYAAAMPGRGYRLAPLSVAELRHYSIIRYPSAEETLRRRGFVSDVEVKGFKRGENSAEIAYLAHNRAAATFQLATIESLLEPRKGTTKGKARRKRGLGGLIGQDEGAPIPLVERDGVLLPCRKFWQPEQIHFAHSAALLAALRQGRRDPAGFCHPTQAEIRAQVQFERRNSRALFNGTGATALLLWQAQALAALRKAAWQIEFFTGAGLNATESLADEQRRRALQRLRDDPALTEAGPVLNAFEVALADHRDMFDAAVREVIEDASERDPYGTAFGVADYQHGLTTEQNVVAALHGSTYYPDFDPENRVQMSEPINWLQPVAKWLGELKRRRYAVLDQQIANNLLSVFGEDGVGSPYDPQLWRYAPMIQDRLNDAAWTIIRATALELQRDGTAQAVPVLYNWTRDAAEPWAAERRANGAIVICGPLLDFPLSRATYWNRKSRILREKGELAFHRRCRS